jgi:hypothetical protein
MESHGYRFCKKVDGNHDKEAQCHQPSILALHAQAEAAQVGRHGAVGRNRCRSVMGLLSLWPALGGAPWLGGLGVQDLRVDIGRGKTFQLAQFFGIGELAEQQPPRPPNVNGAPLYALQAREGLPPIKAKGPAL